MRIWSFQYLNKLSCEFEWGAFEPNIFAWRRQQEETKVNMNKVLQCNVSFDLFKITQRTPHLSNSMLPLCLSLICNKKQTIA